MIVSKDLDIELGIGVLVFNPNDDIKHLERIKKCLQSILITFKLSSFSCYFCICKNTSIGIGKNTKKFINRFCIENRVDLLNYNSINANARAYNLILKHIHKNTNAEKICVLADDYIVPVSWVDIMLQNFQIHPGVDFIMPISTFIPQENLRVDIPIHNDWEVKTAPKGDHVKWKYETVYSGVEIEHINEIASIFLMEDVIPYCDPPSFETTIFTRSCIDQVGYIHPEYFSSFYNKDYFRIISKKGMKGLIAKNGFIFHYGKGGTKSFYTDTADEKFVGSPVEHQVVQDLEIWNQRWNENIKPWWGKPDPITRLDRVKIHANFILNKCSGFVKRVQNKFRMRNFP